MPEHVPRVLLAPLGTSHGSIHCSTRGGGQCLLTDDGDVVRDQHFASSVLMAMGGKVSHVWRRVEKSESLEKWRRHGACGWWKGSVRRMTESGRGQSMKLTANIPILR